MHGRHSREGGNQFIVSEQPTSMGPRLRGDDAAAHLTAGPGDERARMKQGG